MMRYANLKQEPVALGAFQWRDAIRAASQESSTLPAARRPRFRECSGGMDFLAVERRLPSFLYQVARAVGEVQSCAVQREVTMKSMTNGMKNADCRIATGHSQGFATALSRSANSAGRRRGRHGPSTRRLYG